MHFSTPAVQGFASDFLNPGPHGPHAHPEDWQHPETFDVEDEEDDLGYYDDGVKRTLTDEQVAIFRHSEIQALRRERERNQDKSASLLQHGASDMSATKVDQGEAMITENSEASVSEHTQRQSSSASQKKKKKNKKAGRSKQQEPKPDLRKRTWDVVETGLDTLEYD